MQTRATWALAALTLLIAAPFWLSALGSIRVVPLTGVAAGGARSIQMRVTVGSGAATGATRSSVVTATSTHSAAAVDAIRTVVRVG